MAAGAVVLSAIPIVGTAVAVAGAGYGIYRYVRHRNTKK